MAIGAIRRLITASVCVIACVAGPLASASPTLALEADTLRATAGYYQLRWESGGMETVLVEATDPSFSDAQVIYAGPDTARLMSGKPDGVYYYRLETGAATATARRAAVSDTLTVTVEHHSLERAFAFFAAGAAVFAATLGLIVFGGRNERG